MLICIVAFTVYLPIYTVQMVCMCMCMCLYVFVYVYVFVLVCFINMAMGCFDADDIT